MDDNKDAADTTALLLTLFGFKAWPCNDGFAALEQAGSLLPDLCLIDLNMPGMDGDELALRLREDSPPYSLWR